MEPVLKFVNVNKYYNNNVHALHNISLEIAAGEFVSVIGPSGSGKSTLLRTVNRLIDVSDGEIFLDGEDITGIGGKKLRAVRRKVGMIFQNYNLVYRLSVLQNVLHGYLGYLDGIKGILGIYPEEEKLRAVRRKVGMIFQNYNLVYRLSVLQNVLHGYLGYLDGIKGILGIYPEEEKLRAIGLLEEMGLGAFCYNRAADLSGGQKQRVGIARAIMQRPKIMLADEPIASLDPSSAKNIMDILAGLVKERQITCIVNLHQLEVAKKYSTRIIGLSKGTIVFDGKPEELTDEVVEKIYGTSSANLIGGAESEEQHISYAAC